MNGKHLAVAALVLALVVGLVARDRRVDIMGETIERPAEKPAAVAGGSGSTASTFITYTVGGGGGGANSPTVCASSTGASVCSTSTWSTSGGAPR